MFVSTETRATINLVTITGERNRRRAVKTSKVITKEELAKFLVAQIKSNALVMEAKRNNGRKQPSLCIWREKYDFSHMVYVQAR